MMKPGKNKATSFLKSFKYAFEGIQEAFRQGRNIRVQSCAAVVAVVMGLIFKIDASEWVIIVFCIGGVLGAECFNTSFEDVVDLACPEIHPTAKAAKTWRQAVCWRFRAHRSLSASSSSCRVSSLPWGGSV